MVMLERSKIMEEIYKSMFSGSDLLAEQFTRQMFDLAGMDGTVLIYTDGQDKIIVNQPSRAAFLQDDPDRLTSICHQIDDGDDPCVCKVSGGCVVGTELATESVHCGYFLIFLPGYTTQTVYANMDLIELTLAQAQHICQLIEKNNQLHHMQLHHLSKTSSVLS